HACLQRLLRYSLYSFGLLHRPRAEAASPCCLARHPHGSVRELVHHHQPLHSARLDATLRHRAHRLLLEQIPQPASQQL
ncbi:hypothetical protein BN1708_018805, partial [Verticillium longisporum]